jgi:serine/threonine-protein kinase HipA
LGAVDFQTSATEYVPHDEQATLDQLHRAAELVERGEQLPEALGRALLAGTAIGGARPKALLEDGGVQYIAKFSTSADTIDVVGAEAAGGSLRLGWLNRCALQNPRPYERVGIGDAQP